MLRRSARSLAAAALALTQAPAQAADMGAAEWLLKMSEAAKVNNYQGVAIYRGDEMLESFRVTHRWQDGIERERVQSLTGEPRDIIKQDGKTICLLPKTRRVTADRPTPQALFPGLTREKVQRLMQVYAFDDLGTQRVAGRTCRGIAITPRDQFRYGYEVWADEATAVPLKVNLIGRGGEPLEQMMFTEVYFPENIPDGAFAVAGEPPLTAPPSPFAAPQRVAPPPAVMAASAPGLQRIPPGYHVTMRDVRPLPDGSGTVEHVMLSDGLSAISIFSTRRLAPTGRTPFQGVSQMGAVNAYGRTVGTVQVTVVGEAPQETIKLVGDNFQPPAPAQDAAPAPQK